MRLKVLMVRGVRDPCERCRCLVRAPFLCFCCVPGRTALRLTWQRVTATRRSLMASLGTSTRLRSPCCTRMASLFRCNLPFPCRLFVAKLCCAVLHLQSRRVYPTTVGASNDVTHCSIAVKHESEAIFLLLAKPCQGGSQRETYLRRPTIRAICQVLPRFRRTRSTSCIPVASDSDSEEVASYLRPQQASKRYAVRCFRGNALSKTSWLLAPRCDDFACPRMKPQPQMNRFGFGGPPLNSLALMLFPLHPQPSAPASS